MRRKAALQLILLATALAAQPAQTPTTRVAYGTFEIPTYGAVGSYEEYAKAPNKVLRKFRVPNYGVIQRAFDGEHAWIEEPEIGITSLTGEMRAAIERDAEFLGPGAQLKERYATIADAGRANVEGRDAVLRVLTTHDGVIEKAAFDVETGRLLRIDRDELWRDGLRRPSTLYYDDYRMVNGIPVAHTIRFVSADMIWIVRLKTVMDNVPLDDAAFRQPDH
jgi:hypothetical protein